MRLNAILFVAVIVAIILAIGFAFLLVIKLQGMTVTSWWRTPWKNAEVGGVPGSLHQFGLAWDVVPVTEENEQKLAALGLKIINEGDHLHASIV